MKTLKSTSLITLFILLLSYPLRSNSLEDTVIINFGNNIEILIQTDDEDELRKLKFEELIADIQREVDQVDSSGEKIVIEEGQEKAYLKKGNDDFNGTIRIIIKDPDAFARQMEEFGEYMEEWGNSIGRRFEEGDRTSESSDDTITINIGKERPQYETEFTFNFDIGMNNYLQNGDFPEKDNYLYAVKPWGSWNVAINGVYNIHIAGPLFLVSGGGFSWYNFKFQDARTRLEQTDEATIFERTTDDMNPNKSKLTASYINFSLVPMLDFSGTETHVHHAGPLKINRNKQTGFRIGVGGYAGYRLGSHTKYKYRDDGGMEKDKDRKGFYLNNWRYGGRLQIGFRGLDIYANYDVSELFLEARGPSLNAFSFGLIF